MVSTATPPTATDASPGSADGAAGIVVVVVVVVGGVVVLEGVDLVDAVFDAGTVDTEVRGTSFWITVEAGSAEVFSVLTSGVVAA